MIERDVGAALDSVAVLSMRTVMVLIMYYNRTPVQQEDTWTRMNLYYSGSRSALPHMDRLNLGQFVFLVLNGGTDDEALKPSSLVKSESVMNELQLI